jgi:transmembrane sensor
MVIGSPQQTPLAELLESGFSERTVPILWHRIQGRLHETKRGPQLSFVFALPLTVALAGALVLLGVWGYDSFSRSNDSLRLSSGQLPAALVAEATPRRVELSDGSRIRVAQQSRLEVVSNDKKTFVTALSRGSATFEVNPKANRRWVVEVGLTSVEVVGTVFTVTRSDADVNVSVEKGLVLVRGVAVPGGQQRLGAGQALSTKTTVKLVQANDQKQGRSALQGGTAAAPDADESETELAIEDAPVSGELEPISGTSKTASASPARRDADKSGDTAGSDKQANTTSKADSARNTGTKQQTIAGSPRAPTKIPPNIEALLGEADRAREAGDFGNSLHYFEQVIRLAPRFDPRRGLAAMSVARMTMRSNPSRAAAALQSTLDGMPAALQENAIARLVEAYAKSGQSKEAQRTAERYLKRFPSGRRAEDVRRWASP